MWVWSASLPARFTPRERTLDTHWIEGWVGPKAGMDAVVKRKFPAPAGTRTSDHRARSSALHHWINPFINIYNGNGENYVTLTFIFCSLRVELLRLSNRGRDHRSAIQQAWGMKSYRTVTGRNRIITLSALINMDIGEACSEAVNRIQLVQDCTLNRHETSNILANSCFVTKSTNITLGANQLRFTIISVRSAPDRSVSHARVWNLVSHTKGRTQTWGCSSTDAENIWTQKAQVKRRWWRLHNEELHNLYASPGVIRVIEWRIIKWVGHVARMRKMRNAYEVLVGKAEGKRPFWKTQA
jgi:hypothetical protein